ncbi:N-acylglucosamine 2-epimerase [candidate division KSB1 bacterium]|nr:MAG: N-acylglucosamine 2-epimerase [candidate division KSB1 bacterium]MBC6947035.1 N-acylglucosamine 2-epimerase [candidate division KSB1 bacterium]MCE7941646.1 N-acylglucosamine 2-epimerase [Chlorobi bacterium CHB1]MDL1876042.1 N-acylglucosamine 2-epimerase [Cytophagia bacterium CHB2]
MLKPERIDELITVYRDGLLNDTLPFWQKHAIDRDQGGFLFCLDQDGSVLSTDKPMWIHGRYVWLLSTLCNTVEPRPEWLQLARHGIDFIRRYGFDDDGRMFYSVTREGRPLRKRRYIFTETFGMIALAAYAKATGEQKAAQEASDLFRLVIKHLTTPGLLEPKIRPETRSLKALAIPMIMIVSAQVLRDAINDPLAQEWIDRSIAEIERDFMKPEFEAVLETVGPNGEFIDNFEGRMICPGHSIEAGWFILHEAKQRNNDAHLRKLGAQILDWSWQKGWDGTYGGILYYRDAKGLPCTEYWHDMKFWWPHNEAIIATLLAYRLTGEQKYLRWHGMVHDWAYRHFPDKEYGEWFGYLHRDGSLSTRLKGNMWKGPFHLPRMQWYCWKLLEEMRGG